MNTKNNIKSVQSQEEDIFVYKVTNEVDLKKALYVRFRGYQKYGQSIKEIPDNYDISPHCTILLATDSHGNPLGTMRLLDRRGGQIELDSFLDVDSLLSPDKHPVVEATRLCVPRHPKSKLIKQALWKAYYLYCRYNNIKSMIIWIKSGAKKDYVNYLLFQDLGLDGRFTHPLLGNKEHKTFLLDVASCESLYRNFNPSFYKFFFIDHHPNILAECLPNKEFEYHCPQEQA